jgi:hypothetical protein
MKKNKNTKYLLVLLLVLGILHCGFASVLASEEFPDKQLIYKHHH